MPRGSLILVVAIASCADPIGKAIVTVEPFARWCLLDAQAAIVHGRPRMTADIDITVELGGRNVTTMLQMLESALGQSDLLPRWHAIASSGRHPRNPR